MSRLAVARFDCRPFLVNLVAIRLTSFPNTCFSTCLVVSSVVQLVSDLVSTPYVFRQRHGIKVIPPPVTCVILMMSKMSSIFFTTAPIPTWFLSAGNTHLCFPQLTMCLLFWARTITNFIFTHDFMNRLATIPSQISSLKRTSSFFDF